MITRKDEERWAREAKAEVDALTKESHDINRAPPGRGRRKGTPTALVLAMLAANVAGALIGMKTCDFIHRMFSPTKVSPQLLRLEESEKAWATQISNNVAITGGSLQFTDYEGPPAGGSRTTGSTRPWPGDRKER